MWRDFNGKVFGINKPDDSPSYELHQSYRNENTFKVFKTLKVFWVNNCVLMDYKNELKI